MKLKGLFGSILVLFSLFATAGDKTPEEMCQYFAREIPETAREGRSLGLSASAALNAMQGKYLHLKGQGKMDGVMELWAWAINESYQSSSSLEELQDELYKECLGMGLTEQKLREGLGGGGTDVSYENDTWEFNLVEDRFTGNKACEVYTRFMRDEDGDGFLRTLVIPYEGKRLNRQGDYFDESYALGVGSAATVRSGLQALVDNQRVSFDANRSQAIESMLHGRHLQVRYTYRALGIEMQESRSLTLQGFNDAWHAAQSACSHLN